MFHNYTVQLHAVSSVPDLGVHCTFCTPHLVLCTRNEIWGTIFWKIFLVHFLKNIVGNVVLAPNPNFLKIISFAKMRYGALAVSSFYLQNNQLGVWTSIPLHTFCICTLSALHFLYFSLFLVGYRVNRTLIRCFILPKMFSDFFHTWWSESK